MIRLSFWIWRLKRLGVAEKLVLDSTGISVYVNGGVEIPINHASAKLSHIMERIEILAAKAGMLEIVLKLA